MTTALVSAVTGVPVRQDLAMTGEVTLRGRVLPIGGLKEKSMAAYKHGIATVIIPKLNEPDVEECDAAVRENVNFVSVESLQDVLKYAIIDPVQLSDREWNRSYFPVKKANLARVTQ